MSARHQNWPVNDSRKVSIGNVRYANGEHHFKQKDWNFTGGAIVPIAGVHALRAAFVAAKIDQQSCACQAVYSQPTPATHSVWIVPLSGAPARHYLVDASGRAALAT